MKQKQIFTFRDAEKQVAPAAFSIMLKPAGSACNLDCHYCYYLDKAVQYGGRLEHRRKGHGAGLLLGVAESEDVFRFHR